MSEPTYRPATGADHDALARFLGEHHWPFHARARLGPAEAVAGWDPSWDLRIAEGHRGDTGMATSSPGPVAGRSGGGGHRRGR